MNPIIHWRPLNNSQLQEILHKSGDLIQGSRITLRSGLVLEINHISRSATHADPGLSIYWRTINQPQEHIIRASCHWSSSGTHPTNPRLNRGPLGPYQAQWAIHANPHGKGLRIDAHPYPLWAGAAPTQQLNRSVPHWRQLTKPQPTR